VEEGRQRGSSSSGGGPTEREQQEWRRADTEREQQEWRRTDREGAAVVEEDRHREEQQEWRRTDREGAAGVEEGRHREGAAGVEEGRHREEQQEWRRADTERSSRSGGGPTQRGSSRSGGGRTERSSRSGGGRTEREQHAGLEVHHDGVISPAGSDSSSLLLLQAWVSASEYVVADSNLLRKRVRNEGRYTHLSKVNTHLSKVNTHLSTVNTQGAKALLLGLVLGRASGAALRLRCAQLLQRLRRRQLQDPRLPRGSQQRPSCSGVPFNPRRLR
jgi:hypothetical protein